MTPNDQSAGTSRQGIPSTLGLAASFGFGDRLGLATPGHLQALKEFGQGILGIFAQQSVREMTRTRRTPAQVMAAAAQVLVRQTPVPGGKWGADADHLKAPADADAAIEAGFTFITLDPSDHVDPQADSYSSDELDRKFQEVRGQTPWVDQYLGREVQVEGGPVIPFDEPTVRRAAVKYGRAIAHALMMAAHIRQAAMRRGSDYEIELSVDETPQPTTLAEHYIIADQCRLHRERGMNLVSLAPRFIGEFEKGVDFKGDLRRLEISLNHHAAIARQLGPYKLSLHSGSDKLSMYPALARATRGCFHVKTAGASYLEALRVVARHDEALFRALITFARTRYDVDKATYCVSATVDGTPAPEQVSDPRQLEAIYLQDWSEVPHGKGFTAVGRQILHCTFGSVMTHPTLGPAVQALLQANTGAYTAILVDHFGRHLAALRAGM